MMKSDGKNILKIRTLHNAVLRIPLKDVQTFGDVKKYACRGNSLTSDDLIIIRGGKEICDNEIVDGVDTQTQKIFIFVKKHAKSEIKIYIKNERNEEIVLSFPVNTKVCDIKKHLYKAKLTAIRYQSQRMLCKGQVLHDCYYIGDFALIENHSQLSQKNATKLMIHVSSTIDLNKEVNVSLVLPNGKKIKESIGISTPIEAFREILWRQHAFPKTLPVFFYLSSDGSNDNLKELDPQKTLHDYDIESDVSIKLLPRRIEPAISLAPFISMISPNLVVTAVPTIEDKENKPPLPKPSNAPKDITELVSEKIQENKQQSSSIKPQKNKSGGLFGGMGLKKGFLNSEKNKKPKRDT